MTDTLNITVVDDPVTGFFWVLLENRCVAIFNYCAEPESGFFFTKKQAKKLANKLARKIEKSTIIETEKGIKLLKPKRNNNDQR